MEKQNINFTGCAFHKNLNRMSQEIKKLKKELKEWKFQEVKERFERVNSQLHIVAINELKHKIKMLKRGEVISEAINEKLEKL
jgi:electron transfer flavoprotein alpha/beta subunit